MHIVPNPFGNRLPFHPGKDGGNVHHSPAHGRGGVELLLDGCEVDLLGTELLNQLCEVPDVAADPVQTVDDNGPKGPLGRVSHHSLEFGPF